MKASRSESGGSGNFRHCDNRKEILCGLGYPAHHCLLNASELAEGDGFGATVQRIVVTTSFREKFGDFNLPPHLTPDYEFGAMVPLGNDRSSKPRKIGLLDRTGGRQECVAESLANTYQVFILIHAVRTLAKSTVIIPTQTD